MSILVSLSYCLSREWLLSFGTGGYASSTLCGINERTYHGYLIVPLEGILGKRYLLLSKFEDFFIDNKGVEYPLSTNHYFNNVYYPEGYKYIKEVERGDNYIRWIYEFDRTVVTKTLSTFEGYNAILLSYEASREGTFILNPLVAYRSHHLVMSRENSFFDYDVQDKIITISFNNYPLFNIKINNSKFVVENTRYWYYNFFYKFDYERGTNYHEDLFNPFRLKFENTNKIDMIAYYGDEVKINEGKKERQLSLKKTYEVLDLLANATKAFVVKTKNGWSIVAGYHWFDEWGRDTFISMEGLLLMHKRFEIAKEILVRYLTNMQKGIVPNHFLPDGEPLYLGVDVSLWLINAIYKLYIYSSDRDFINKVFSYLLDIIDNYINGNGIVYSEDYLIYHKGAPRTWMDAEIDGQPVTPREGASVEANSLFFNAIKIISTLNQELKIGYDLDKYEEFSDKMKQRFKEKFLSSKGYLYDYIDQYGRPNELLRPNQLLAISLPFSIIDEPNLANNILRIIEIELLRPYGLSTLAKGSPGYTPYYRGDKRSRDLAYHNGVIWPWLIGSYVDAKIKFENNKINLRKLITYFDPLIQFIRSNFGFVVELFEDIPPYNPGGCIAQAWSVAEFYRSLYRLISYI